MTDEKKILKIRRLVSVIQEATRELEELTQTNQVPEPLQKRQNLKDDRKAKYILRYSK